MDKKSLLNSVEGFPMIGWCTHWAGIGFSLPYSDFVKKLEKAGIDPAFARETLAKNAFLRAVKETAKGKTTFSRKVVDEANQAVAVIAKEKIDQHDLEYETSQESTVVFDKSDKTIKVKGKSRAEIEGNFDHFKVSYTASQFRSVVLRYVKKECDGIMVKDGGGLYFVPSFKSREFEKLMHLFELMGEKVELGAIPIVDTKTARASMWQAMQGNTRDEIAKLEKDIEEIEDLTSKAFDQRIKKYNDLKLKAEMYACLMESKAEEMTKSLDQLTKKLKSKLEG